METDNLEKLKKCPIGVFDSGMGGISVLRELVKVMPEEDYIYFGDSANAPYGTKPTEVIRELTIRQEKFRKLMACYEDQIRIVPLPCPGLMEFVERGDLAGEDLRTYLQELLQKVSQEPIDGIVLGCTHYPFVRKMIQEIAGEGVTIYDGGPGTAREMRRRLAQKNLLNPKQEEGTVTFFNSRKTKQEMELCQMLFHSGR